MRTLQVTQVATISRADLVLADSNDYEQLKFQRRRLISLPNGTEIYLASPEEISLSTNCDGASRVSLKSKCVMYWEY